MVDTDRSIARPFLSRAYDAVMGVDVAACSPLLATGAILFIFIRHLELSFFQYKNLAFRSGGGAHPLF